MPSPIQLIIPTTDSKVVHKIENQSPLRSHIHRLGQRKPLAIRTQAAFLPLLPRSCSRVPGAIAFTQPGTLATSVSPPVKRHISTADLITIIIALPRVHGPPVLRDLADIHARRMSPAAMAPSARRTGPATSVDWADGPVAPAFAVGPIWSSSW